MDRVGSICVVDLEALWALRGQRELPYPLGRSRPVGSAWLLGLDEYPIASRVRGSDVGAFHEWAAIGARADIWVGCQVQYPGQDIPDLRIHAFRAGDAGYLAVQRPDDEFVDVVEISTLSAYDLGAAVADATQLTGPGAHSQVVIPRYRDYFRPDTDWGYDDSDDICATQIRDTASKSEIDVADADVVVVGSVQSSHYLRTASGLSMNKELVAWVRVRGDGEYVFCADFSSAEPVTTQALARRIDELIAADVRTLRGLRNKAD